MIIVCLTTFHVVVYPVECRTWEQLLNHAESAELPRLPMNEQGPNYYFQNPLTSTLQLDLAISRMKKGGFKLAAFGTSMSAIFNTKAKGTEAICAKRAYNTVERIVEVNGSLTTKVVTCLTKVKSNFNAL